MRPLAFVLLVLLAGCGADGAPVKPQQDEEPAARPVGVTFSGSASMGVAGSRLSR